MLLNILCMVAGIFVVVLTLSDAFQVVIVPRATGRRFRISFYLWRQTWYIWPTLAWRLYPQNVDAREEFMAIFAPFMLVTLLGSWVVLLILGFALMLFALRSSLMPPNGSFGAMLYFAGSSMLTIGFGDIVGRGAGARLVSVMAALAGLSLLSMSTAFLFAIFGSFQQRETFVVTLAARAGTPPSGVSLLCISGYSLTHDDLPRVMIEAQRWTAQVMESHLAYPSLAFFRSSHDDQSWIGTLGTLLDAATLLMTTVEGPKHGQARIMYNVGRHATHDLSHYFRTGGSEDSVGIERSEFESACDRLVAAGFPLRDRDQAWAEFAKLRSSYASHLNELARFFQIPPIAWIGDRSSITRTPHH